MADFLDFWFYLYVHNVKRANILVLMSTNHYNQSRTAMKIRLLHLFVRKKNKKLKDENSEPLKVRTYNQPGKDI